MTGKGNIALENLASAEKDSGRLKLAEAELYGVFSRYLKDTGKYMEK